jgi:hypothetical protein
MLIQAALRVERGEASRLGLDPHGLPVGAIVGSVEIVACIRDSKSKWAIPGQWHWILENPRWLDTPIPFKGKLGFMQIPAELLRGKQFYPP